MPITFTTYPTVSTLNFSNGTITTIWNYGGTLTGGLLSPLFLVMAFFVVYAALVGQNYKEHAYLSASLITLFLAFGMVGAGVMSPLYMLMAIANTGVGLYISSRLNEVG